MRKLITIFLSIISLTLLAQVPQGVGYQGVAADANGIELVNQSISIKASVLSASANGTVEWEETHATSTDTFGLFTLTIGQGTSTGNGAQLSFSDISWGTNTHFLKIEMDVNGGSNYSFMGTNQMMSVPYALYAENANIDYDSISTMISNDSAFIISITGGLSGNSFGERIPINLQWYGPITNSFTSYNSFFTTEIQAQEDGFLTGTVNTSTALDFFCDTFSGNATYFGQFSDSYGTTKSTFNFPIKEGDYYYVRYSNSYYFGQVLDIFCTPLESGGGSSSSTTINYDSLANIISMDSTFLANMFDCGDWEIILDDTIMSTLTNQYTVSQNGFLYPKTEEYALEIYVSEDGGNSFDSIHIAHSHSFLLPVKQGWLYYLGFADLPPQTVHPLAETSIYFIPSCGGGGSSTASTGLDSATVADMIQNAIDIIINNSPT